jgi:hypothetical protein
LDTNKRLYGATREPGKGVRRMSLAEILLVIGTFGICTGVWTTLVVMLKQNSKTNEQEKSVTTVVSN